MLTQPVISYRVDGYGESIHRVHMPGGGVFETAAMAAPGFEETMAILPLDDCTVLGAYVDGDQVMTASVFNDKGVELDGPIVLGGPRGRPALAAADGAIYLAWWEPPGLPDDGFGWDPLFEELWLQRMTWDGTNLLESGPPIPLPRHDSHRLGDQIMPALASVPYWPNGGLLAAWTDLTGTNYAGQAPHGDVALQPIPTPVFRLGAE